MITFPLELFFPFTLAFLRALGLLLLLPVLSSPSIPRLVRACLIAVLAGVSFGFIASTTAKVPSNGATMLWSLTQELVVGLLMGWSVRLLFHALEFGGQIISTEVGLMLSSSLDPVSHQSSSPAASMLSWLGTMLFLLSGAYRECLAAFVRSFTLFPPGSALSASSAEFILARTGQVFSLALQFAAPILAVNFFVNFIFALLGRIAPSLDAYANSVAVRLVAGLATLSLSLGLAAQLALQDLRDIPTLIFSFLR